ncbi:cell division ATP-binding protein FtsE [Peptoniphilus equinus]|uniref:Cell division ATP-binding protein FtsE n=1 Tax=Peptoniphilus equinus TaxID=3016343 RepID=A0ABY7QRW4_9FIRM|nr:cell division ATP-binding protein FtsE [Peptoniphilus equinus]WBW49512.1 cell division ATP-binding protein FtsE [Peptoniphilus equinus]
MITFKNVFKEYGNGVMALSNINLTVPRGDFVFLVGSSGAGKSTLVKLLIREESVTRGNIYIHNQDITKLTKTQVPRLRRNISVVFQDFRLLAKRNVYENVVFPLEVQGHSRAYNKEHVEHALELVGLKDKAKSYPSELSGGEGQRVSIARAIVNHAPYLVCDEPTGNLDEHTAMEIMAALENINKAGTTIIMATHAINIVNTMQKRVITLKGGKIESDVERGSYYEMV